MSTFLGKAIVWGIPEDNREIIGLPADALEVRLRFRVGSVGVAVIRTPTSVHKYFLWYPEHHRRWWQRLFPRKWRGSFNGRWGLMEQGRNQRV